MANFFLAFVGFLVGVGMEVLGAIAVAAIALTELIFNYSIKNLFLILILLTV